MNDTPKEFWNNRYAQGNIKWDIGNVSTPIKEYIDQIEDKTISILIPGCGNAHEAEYLHNKGFKNVWLLDIAPQPLLNFSKRVPTFPKENLLNHDFFAHSGKYDLIIEQTFFCAIPPAMRSAYVKAVAKMLKTKGKLVGLLFDSTFESGPPFGGDIMEYESLFLEKFDILIMEKSYNSIPKRMDNELFIIMKKV